MNAIYEKLLKGMRKLCGRIPDSIPPFMDAEESSAAITAVLSSGKPCMIARYGSTELNCIVNGLGVQGGAKPLSFIKGRSPQWWWNQQAIFLMQEYSGFFPLEMEYIDRFCRLMGEDAKELDLLASWRYQERFIPSLDSVPKIPLVYLEPWWSSKPWTAALEGKRVLVVHPFAEEIRRQYAEVRESLFERPDILPEFSLTVIPAVQSLGGEKGQYANWFEALEDMERKMDAVEYDIALIGCGAYGFPLAAHAKRTGHQAVHMGGALQLLFGIKGRRWEDPQYGVREWGLPEGYYPQMFNESWIRPGESVRPRNANQVENACYW